MLCHQNFRDVENIVSGEASSLSALVTDVSAYPEPVLPPPYNCPETIANNMPLFPALLPLLKISIAAELLVVFIQALIVIVEAKETSVIVAY